MPMTSIRFQLDISALRMDMDATVDWLEEGHMPIKYEGAEHKVNGTTTVDQIMGSPLQKTVGDDDQQDSSITRNVRRSGHSSERRGKGARSKSLNRRKKKELGDPGSRRSGRSASPRGTAMSPVSSEEGSIQQHGNRTRLSTGDTATLAMNEGFCTHADKHTFNQYRAPRPVECDSCHRRTSPGEMLLGCSKCQFDECGQCTAKRCPHAVQEVAKPDAIVERPIAVTPAVEKRQVYKLAELHRELRKDLPSESGSLCSTAAPSDRSSECSHISDVGPIQISVSTTITVGGGRKECKYCKGLWKGFGDSCATCRRAGPEGPIRHCEKCGANWQGWNECDTCG